MIDSFGINAYGYFDEHSGLSESARSNVMALEKAGVPVRVFNYTYNNELKKESSHLKLSNQDASFNINLVHININFIEDFLNSVGTEFLENKYNIAYWAWEYTEPPLEILPYLDFFDEIWVPSYFCVEAFARYSNIPVLKFSHPIPKNEIELSRAELNLPENKFLFLTVFDSISSLERKNPIAVIKAFKEAFGINNKDVSLVIKTVNLELFPNEMKEIKDLLLEFSNVIIINEFLKKEALVGLIKNCDAFISLHRSEGFGLTMAEAMRYGKPVVATGYSGNLDYMNAANSYLVDYNIIETSKDYGLTKKGFKFADASVNDAKNCLLDVYNDEPSRTLKSKKAKAFTNQFLTLDYIGNIMKDRLEFISKNNLSKNSTSNNSAKLSLELSNLKKENNDLAYKVKRLEKTLYNKIRSKINKLFKSK